MTKENFFFSKPSYTVWYVFFKNPTKDIQALSCPTENSSNMKFLHFSCFGDNFGLPGSGSAESFVSGSQSGSETLVLCPYF
jgi:hypothetical protein